MTNKIMVASNKRSPVTPGAPITGNSVLARDAPLWIEVIASNSNPTGNRGKALFLVSADMDRWTSEIRNKISKKMADYSSIKENFDKENVRADY
ncbi:hypothetical protein QVM87_08725 [Providencia stuartii]|nr:MULTISPECIES: hypothetical protein [Providencia]MDN0005469.1 hypothetical protein [Providencia stuartii]MDN0010230.1 hypothetical protein [Providencia stuartii]MDT1066891.1 hypothetical protein [Providencia stuartii]